MENKKTKIISIVAIVALALTVITATYAYFNAQVGDPAAADVKINANTVDTFTFSSGSAISFSINQDNFASGAGNQTGSTYASALLTANNKTNSSGTEVTDISTLNHVIVTGANGTQVSGYDITNKSGLITLFDNREITTTSSKEEKWNITITFVNYDENQNGNAGKSMSAKVMIQKEKIIAYISDVCSNNDNLANCLTTLENVGVLNFTNLYHHDSSLANGAGDNSYRYSGANPNNYVCFGSNESTCPTNNLYRIIGVFEDNVKIIKYDYATSELLGTDGDYYGQYTYDSPNYKGNTYANIAYYWNKSTRTNTWSESKLNKTNLNTNFVKNIGTEWADKIATTTWKVGGNTENNIRYVVPFIAYQNEIVNPVTTKTTDSATEYTAKIGLMYVSDYGFAAEPSVWTLTMDNYNNTTAISTNWMYLGLFEWTISRSADDSSYVFNVSPEGHVSSNRVYYTRFGVRPSFSLLSSVTYVGGSGIKLDPIRIN